MSRNKFDYVEFEKPEQREHFNYDIAAVSEQFYATFVQYIQNRYGPQASIPLITAAAACCEFMTWILDASEEFPEAKAQIKRMATEAVVLRGEVIH
jgi:hypothetical protein